MIASILTAHNPVLPCKGIIGPVWKRFLVRNDAVLRRSSASYVDKTIRNDVGKENGSGSIQPSSGSDMTGDGIPILSASAVLRSSPTELYNITGVTSIHSNLNTNNNMVMKSSAVSEATLTNKFCSNSGVITSYTNKKFTVLSKESSRAVHATSAATKVIPMIVPCEKLGVYSVQNSSNKPHVVAVSKNVPSAENENKVVPELTGSGHHNNDTGYRNSCQHTSSSTSSAQPQTQVQSENNANNNNNNNNNNNAADANCSNGPDTESRVNPLGIQMLSKNLFQQIFQYSQTEELCQTADKGLLAENDKDIHQAISHLKQHKLWDKKNTRNKDVKLKLPQLSGNNLNEHFEIIAKNQSKPYRDLLHNLTHNAIPCIPKKFTFREGWTKYNSDGTSHSVEVPDCRAFVFDVEVCVRNGSLPTLAAAVSSSHWYTWCSSHLMQASAGDDMVQQSSQHNGGSMSGEEMEGTDSIEANGEISETPASNSDSKFQLEHLIPFGGADAQGNTTGDCGHRIIVGHNVSYDRIRIKEQYFIPDYPLRFLDTMSLHIAVSGLVQEQRALVMKNKTATDQIKLPWMSVGALNNLNDVYKFYCKTDGLEKQTRDIFVKGSLCDIRNDFQNLMAYCAKDVQATHKVLVNLLPMFYDRFPHSVTFGGILEMGSCILPVNHNWPKYIDSSEHMYSKMQGALTENLSQRAISALELQNENNYEKDPWLWNLDWEVPIMRKKKGNMTPKWFINLCKTGEKGGTPELSNMSTSLRVVPKLLRLTWKDFPLHHEKDHGWGYLRPKYSSYNDFLSSNEASIQEDSITDANTKLKFPLEIFYSICPQRKNINKVNQSEFPETEEDWEQILYGGVVSKKSKRSTSTVQSSLNDNPEDIVMDVDIPGVEFIRLPHKNGPKHNVGNPLAKDFLPMIEDGTLSSNIAEVAALVLKTTKSIAYWRNARDRIISQETVWLSEDNLPDIAVNSSEYSSDPSSRYGTILPAVVVCGTVTRRAVERTWLTASNARLDRIGSELKAIVTAPPGYHFVGADVDSQELWIAALLGDAYFAGIHGCTAMSWMTLQGSKAEGTDLHSKTAHTAHITRDQAKVLNYGRIYGAGLRFLQTLLVQYNPSLPAAEARLTAENIMRTTKGEKGWTLSDEGRELVKDRLNKDLPHPLSRLEIYSLLRELMRKHNIHRSYASFTNSPAVWTNGSESYTFNCLESIVRQDKPASPVLSAAIPKPLQPGYVGSQYMTSRLNWVVQSSAVDYLHLMTVCMRWLADQYSINMRFSISIHDEVRYLVASEDRHRAALALQITNLLTRALFAERVGMSDLPLSVAFFSSVDIDKVMRKDPLDSCVTPSNPRGLQAGYGIEDGKTLSIYELLDIVQSLQVQPEQR